MTWLTWRLQRTELLLLGLIILVLGGALLRTHADLVAESKRYTADTCPVPLSGGGGTELVCSVPVSRLYLIVNQWLEWFDVIPLLAALLLVLPAVLELENGTHRLAWTQGVARSRWLRAKLAVVALSGMAFSALFALAFSWWSAPMREVQGIFHTATYDLRGTLPIGYTLFAAGLMLAIGVTLRRPVITIILAAVVYLAVLTPVSLWVRPHLYPAVTKPTHESVDTRAPAGERTESNWSIDDWMLSQDYRDRDGNVLSSNEFWTLCDSAADSELVCMVESGLVSFTTFHPPSHYWPLQLVETGLYLAAGAALIGFAAWYVLRRIE